MGFCNNDGGKMRFALIMGVLFISFTSLFSQQNTVDAKGRKQGSWIKYYPNGKTPEFKGTFIDGKPTGLFYYYAPDGGVTMVADHNVITGRSAVYFYHENKQVKCFGVYRDMKKDSVWTYYSNTGIISKRETYKNDVLEGTVYSYFVNNMKKGAPSRVVEETPYVKGQRNGVEKEYFLGGSLKREATYKNDKLNGPYKNYTIEGTLESEAYYFNNKLHGMTTYHLGPKREYSYYVYGDKMTLENYKKWLEKCKANKLPTNLPNTH